MSLENNGGIVEAPSDEFFRCYLGGPDAFTREIVREEDGNILEPSLTKVTNEVRKEDLVVTATGVN